ncbi:MAG: hypothetical protein U1E74_03765 [Paenacidovorax caeni]
MALDYLDFDYSEDFDGNGTWDAMAAVRPERMPALRAELAQLLAWAHAAFAGRQGRAAATGITTCRRRTRPANRCTRAMARARWTWRAHPAAG